MVTFTGIDLTKFKKRSVTILTGLNGSGKTEFYHRYLSNTEDCRSVFFLQNIENNLHPQRQVRDVNVWLENRIRCNDYMVFETHSDHVINAIRVAVKELRLKEEDVELLNFETETKDYPHSEVRRIFLKKNGDLSEYPDGLMDEYETQLLKLI